jgi:hypothetical protein
MGKMKELWAEIEEEWNEMLFHYHMNREKKKVIYKNKIKGENHGNGRIRNKSKSKRINR